METANFTIDDKYIYILDNVKNQVVLFDMQTGLFVKKIAIPFIAEEIGYLFYRRISTYISVSLWVKKMQKPFIDKYEIVSENANCVRLNRIKNSPLSFWVLLPLFTLNIDVYMLNKKYTTF